MSCQSLTVNPRFQAFLLFFYFSRRVGIFTPAKTLACGLRSSGDKIHPEDWGGRITELFPGYSDLPAVTEPPIGGEDQPPRNDPMWIRVYLRHDKIANALGFRFRSFDETLRDMIMSLESIGGVQYNCAS